MKFQHIPLGQKVKVVGGFAFKSDQFTDIGIPILRISNIIGDGTIDLSRDIVYYPFSHETKDFELAENDFVMAMSGATTGKVGRIEKTHIPCLLNQRVAKFILKDDTVMPDYLFWILRSPFYQRALWDFASGCAQPNISSNQLEAIKIPIFDKNVQKKIASLLLKTESALKKCRQTIHLADELLKSVFFKMFGDPVNNSRKWPVKDFKNSFFSIIYGTGSPPNYEESGLPFIRATNIKKGTVVPKDMKFISIEEANKIKKCRISYGDLILVRSGVNAGDCGLIPRLYDGAYAAYDLIIKLPYPSAVFFNHLINSDFGKTMLAPLKRRAGQPHLNAEQISSLKFITPPIDAQQKFADLVQKVEKLKEKQKQSEAELTNLFNALMQKAFNGSL